MISAEKPVYLLGIGGMGMCPLALYLVGRGYVVYGSDDHLKPEMERLLVDNGVRLRKDLGDCGTLIYSNAVDREHPVRVAAREAGVVEVRRGEAVAEVLKGEKVVAVCGSHGKTTVTGLLIHLFERAGVGVSYLLGSMYQDKARVPGRYDVGGEYVVVEVDESDGSIEAFEPELTVCLNVDHDHHARYETEGALLEAFGRLFERTRGGVIVPAGCGKLEGIAPVGSGFFELDEDVVRSNENAAMAVMGELGVGVERGMFEGVPGLDRRMETLYRDEGVWVVHDYAHHPTEIRALLGRFLGKGQSVTVVFEPHRYSRTAALAGEFGEALMGADSVYLLPVYGAFEEVIEGGTSEAILEAMGGHPSVQLVSREELPVIESGALLFVGAGTIGEYAREYARGYAFRKMGEGLGEGSVVREWEPLAKKTTLRAGGEARFYVEPAGVADLQLVLRFADAYGVEVFMLGRGSNLIVADGGFDGVVVRLSGEGFKGVAVDAEAGLIEVGAGVRLKEVCGLARKAGLGGFEFLEGIPGSVGGALRMNAGAMGGWMFDVVESVMYINTRGELVEVSGADLETGYRSCEELKLGGVAVGARLRAKEVGVGVEVIEGVLEGFAGKRKESQPREPSSGCIFKNPEGNYAGKLIEEAGCKGMRVGGAEVSEVHGNFIINRGGARASEVLELAKRVRGEVYGTSGVWLEPEVLLLGESWERVLSV